MLTLCTLNVVDITFNKSAYAIIFVTRMLQEIELLFFGKQRTSLSYTTGSEYRREYNPYLTS